MLILRAKTTDGRPTSFLFEDLRETVPVTDSDGLLLRAFTSYINHGGNELYSQVTLRYLDQPGAPSLHQARADADHDAMKALGIDPTSYIEFMP